MYLVNCLITLLVIAVPCHAFYPYHFPTDNLKLEPLTALSSSVKFPVYQVKRANRFSILNSNAPAQENSIAVDQDGNDLSYMVQLEFGSSNKPMYMLLDSAAINTWVMSSSCTTSACQIHNTFGPEDSTTLTVNPRNFSITYGSGSVSGVTATDTVTLLDTSVPLTFGLADVVSSDFSNYPMDGILGVGRLDQARVRSTGVGAPTLIDTLSTNGHLSPKLIGLRLSRSSDDLRNGELSFGAPDTSAFTGSLDFVSAITNANGFWELPLQMVQVNGQLASIQPNISLIIDTGTSYLLIPPADATAVHSLIPGAQGDGSTFSVPCDTNIPIVLTINGQSYNISASDYVGYAQTDGNCTSNIVGRTTFSSSQWLVGDVFIKNVYTVFDYDNGKLGLAPLLVDSKSEPSSTSGNANSAPSVSSSPSSSTLIQSNSASSAHPIGLQLSILLTSLACSTILI